MTSLQIQRIVGGSIHTLTFPNTVESKTDITCDYEETETPSGAVMNNIAVDAYGNTKTITISGDLVDSLSGSFVTGTSAPTITTKEQLKFWIESLCDGNQNAKTFISNLDSYSVLSAGSSTVEGVIMPATFVATKVYVKTFHYEDNKGISNQISFTLVLWVAGF